MQCVSASHKSAETSMYGAAHDTHSRAGIIFIAFCGRVASSAARSFRPFNVSAAFWQKKNDGSDGRNARTQHEITEALLQQSGKFVTVCCLSDRTYTHLCKRRFISLLAFVYCLTPLTQRLKLKERKKARNANRIHNNNYIVRDLWNWIHARGWHTNQIIERNAWHNLKMG